MRQRGQKIVRFLDEPADHPDSTLSRLVTSASQSPLDTLIPTKAASSGW